MARPSPPHGVRPPPSPRPARRCQIRGTVAARNRAGRRRTGGSCGSGRHAAGRVQQHAVLRMRPARSSARGTRRESAKPPTPREVAHSRQYRTVRTGRSGWRRLAGARFAPEPFGQRQPVILVPAQIGEVLGQPNQRRALRRRLPRPTPRRGRGCRATSSVEVICTAATTRSDMPRRTYACTSATPRTPHADQTVVGCQASPASSCVLKSACYKPPPKSCVAPPEKGGPRARLFFCPTSPPPAWSPKTPTRCERTYEICGCSPNPT